MSFQNCKIVGVNVCATQYHANKGERGKPDFVMSPSQMKRFAQQPNRWVRGLDDSDSSSKRWGNLVDCLLLTPDKFFERYAVEPETYLDIGMKCPVCGSITDSKSCRACKVDRVKTENIKAWRYGAKFTDQWKEDRLKEGKEVISRKDLVDADNAVKDCLLAPIGSDDTVARWVRSCEKQVHITGEWADKATGIIIPVSALLDFVPFADSEFGACLGDFKTARTVHPRRFERDAFNFGYHIQAAFDIDIFNAATGQDRNTWCFVAQENEPPYEFNLMMFGQEGAQGLPGFVEMGREERWGGYRRILADYAKCLKTGHWPRYADQFESVQGWCILNPDMGMTIRAEMGTFQFPSEEKEQQETEVNVDEVTP